MKTLTLGFAAACFHHIENIFSVHQRQYNPDTDVHTFQNGSNDNQV